MGFYGLDNFIGWSSTVLKNPPSNTRDVGLIRGSRRSSGEGKAAHSSIRTWEILWTEEPGGLQSMGSQRVRRDLAAKQHSNNSPIS